MYNIISIIVILISLAIIVSIVFKKLPLLAGFDISSIPKEKEAETRTKIMEERMARKFKVFYNKIKPFFKIIANFGQRKINLLTEKIKAWEEKYKTAKPPKEALMTKDEFQTLEKKIESQLEAAQDLINQESYQEAEKIYLEILSLEPKNIPAYRGLANLYFVQKQYLEAKQTYQHVIKLNKKDSSSYFALAEILYETEDYNNALSVLQTALNLEPNNPRYLDLFITISILVKDKELARQSLAKLIEVNPDNAKISEFAEQIKTL
ncbi:MAG: tetratricopeptide repeat protein [Patescibacteria group bacterium]